MRWQDERYVRLYTRNTPEWCVLEWKARGLMALLLREVDRAGILELGKLGLRAVAVALRAPWEEIEEPLSKLLDDGMVVHRDDLSVLVIPNFIEAQECSQSDKARKRTERERARDFAKAKSLNVTVEGKNTDEPSRDVTATADSGQKVTRNQKVSQGVTPSRAEPCLAVPSRAVPANGAARLPGLLELETEIRRWPIFAALDAHAIAKAQAERILTGPQKPAWLVVAVAECAEKTPASLGLTVEALTHKLVGFMRNAKRPKETKQARTVVESEPEREPTEAELVANRKRLEEREAKAKAERERREKLGQSLEGPKR